MARAKPLKLQVPAAGADQPRLGRVGAIAGTGFVLGILWPWLAGVALVPRPPTDELARAPQKVASAKSTKKPPAASKAKPARKPEKLPPAKRIKVGKPTITSCRDSEGRTVSACDPIPIDELIVPKIETLQRCEAAKDLQGILSLGMKIEFESGKAERFIQGKSTTVSDRAAQALIDCAEKELAHTSFADVPHNHASYTVFYLVEILPPEEAVTETDDEKGDGDVTEASGMATVAWVAARVRSGPTKESKEVARLASGARVKVVGKKGDWYQVSWDAKGSKGWVYKGAIGMD